MLAVFPWPAIARIRRLSMVLLTESAMLTRLMQLLYELIKEDLRPFIREAHEYIRERRNGREQPLMEPVSPADEHLYNRKEAADFLLVDPRTVTRYRINGKLRFVRNDDGRIRYRREDLHACYFWKWGKKP